MIPSGTYGGRELLSIVEGMVELNQFVVDDQVIKKNKLKGITEITLNLDELNNSDNLKDGHPSMPYLHITWMLIKILHVWKPTPYSTRNLKMESLLP